MHKLIYAECMMYYVPYDRLYEKGVSHTLDSDLQF